MDKIDDVLSKATVIVTNQIDSNKELIEDQKPLVDELVLSFFQLRNSDITKDDVSHLKEIADYVDSVAKTKDRLDKLQVLREIRYKLGEPELGTKRHDQVYQYIRLKQVSKKYAQQAQAMES
jgi:hypothetical protein